jgi:hypothetical protein
MKIAQSKWLVFIVLLFMAQSATAQLYTNKPIYLNDEARKSYDEVGNVIPLSKIDVNGVHVVNFENGEALNFSKACETGTCYRLWNIDTSGNLIADDTYGGGITVKDGNYIQAQKSTDVMSMRHSGSAGEVGTNADPLYITVAGTYTWYFDTNGDFRAYGTNGGDFIATSNAVASLPATCTAGALRLASDSDDCSAGSGNGSLCICNNAGNGWTLVVDY